MTDQKHTPPQTPPKPPPTAAMLVIGDEILSGRTRDKNITTLALMLRERGIDLGEVRIIGDKARQIITAVRALSSQYDLVFTCGGIGPTHDDITTACIAEAMGAEVALNPEADRRLEAYYATRPIPYTPARQKMALIPLGAELIDNPVSAAPGFILGNIFVLAGVPSILTAMLASLGDRLPQGRPIFQITVESTLGEGTMAEGLGTIQTEVEGVRIGSYPWFKPDTGSYGTALVASGRDKNQAQGVAELIAELVKNLGGESVIKRKD